jgi:valyl-tRNA synthetase
LQGYAALWVRGLTTLLLRLSHDCRGNAGRKAFPRLIWAGRVSGTRLAWKEQYGGRIVEQLKKLGTPGLEQERFTLDEG